ncbi:MAG: competence protein ComEA [SAR202 cluster bacterium]|nr:competence protein ComEA [SAR202 cluster bacterium]
MPQYRCCRLALLPGGAVPLAAQPTQGEAEVVVYVTGAVQRPGVYTLQPGDRLADALAAAGGPAPGADLTAVNLARRVQDEGYYYIPRPGEKPPMAADPLAPEQAQGAVTPAAQGLVDINTASASALEQLPGIGPVRAQAIVDYRAINGAFASAEQVTNVPGIGPSTYEKIRHLITVGGTP